MAWQGEGRSPRKGNQELRTLGAEVVTAGLTTRLKKKSMFWTQPAGLDLQPGTWPPGCLCKGAWSLEEASDQKLHSAPKATRDPVILHTGCLCSWGPRGPGLWVPLSFACALRAPSSCHPELAGQGVPVAVDSSLILSLAFVAAASKAPCLLGTVRPGVPRCLFLYQEPPRSPLFVAAPAVPKLRVILRKHTRPCKSISPLAPSALLGATCWCLQDSEALSPQLPLPSPFPGRPMGRIPCRMRVFVLSGRGWSLAGVRASNPVLPGIPFSSSDSPLLGTPHGQEPSPYRVGRPLCCEVT